VLLAWAETPDGAWPGLLEVDWPEAGLPLPFNG